LDALAVAGMPANPPITVISWSKTFLAMFPIGSFQNCVPVYHFEQIQISDGGSP